MDTSTLLAQAHREAQRRFAEMLDAQAYGDPNHPLTLAYVSAERVVDAMLGDAQWERSKAELDALQLADLLADPGDHYAGMPR